MRILSKFFLFVCMVISFISPGYAQAVDSAARGKLLYEKQCNICHTEKIHWRDQKLATDWNGIVLQVNRWKSLLDLKWSESDVADVAHYLNNSFYFYTYTAQRSE